VTDVQEIISRATLNGNILKLPDGQIDRKVYESVAKTLGFIGGKWKGGKVAGFVFDTDPSEKIQIILDGGKVPNLKKEFQYFATPALVAHMLVQDANIGPMNRILEPEAGQGAIVEIILKQTMGMACTVDCYELMPENAEILKKRIATDFKNRNVRFAGHDFLTDPIPEVRWDRIIANPPFANNQDVDHVLKMYHHLADHGVLVAIMSPHWTFAQEKKCVEFRKWIEDVGAEVTELDAGLFKESGTNIKTVKVRIEKP